MSHQDIEFLEIVRNGSAEDKVLLWQLVMAEISRIQGRQVMKPESMNRPQLHAGLSKMYRALDEAGRIKLTREANRLQLQKQLAQQGRVHQGGNYESH